MRRDRAMARLIRSAKRAPTRVVESHSSTGRQQGPLTLVPVSPLLHVHPCVVIPHFRHAADWEPEYPAVRPCSLVSRHNPTAEDQEKFELLFLWKDAALNGLKTGS
jgi:hypothetical protein